MINLAECLRHIPDTLLDKLTTGDCIDKDSVIRGTFIRSFLVANGNQPITLLNSCIDAAFNIEWYVLIKYLSIILHYFNYFLIPKSANVGSRSFNSQMDLGHSEPSTYLFVNF